QAGSLQITGSSYLTASRDRSIVRQLCNTAGRQVGVAGGAPRNGDGSPEAWLSRRVIASGPSPLRAAQLDRKAPGAAAGAFHFCRRKRFCAFGEDPQGELSPVIHARRESKTP